MVAIACVLLTVDLTWYESADHRLHGVVRRSVIAVALALTAGALVAAAPIVLGGSTHPRLFTARQLQAALAHHQIQTEITANKTIARLVSGPDVVALVDDTRDLVGNGSLESGLSGTVLDSIRAARAFDLGHAPGWLRLQRENVVVEVTSSAPKLKADAIAAIRSLK